MLKISVFCSHLIDNLMHIFLQQKIRLFTRLYLKSPCNAINLSRCLLCDVTETRIREREREREQVNYDDCRKMFHLKTEFRCVSMFNILLKQKQKKTQARVLCPLRIDKSHSPNLHSGYRSKISTYAAKFKNFLNWLLNQGKKKYWKAKCLEVLQHFLKFSRIYTALGMYILIFPAPSCGETCFNQGFTALFFF